MPRPADPNTRIELLRAAEAVFTQHGLAAAKVEDITGRAGVSKGAFYLHFESKEDCFRQIAEAFVARLANCVEPPPERPEDGPQTDAERLANWHRHDVSVLEFCWENRGLLRMLLDGANGREWSYLIDSFAERTRRNVEGWVAHGVASGAYREGLDVSVVAALVSGGYDRLARELIRSPQRPDIQAWCRQSLDLFTRGLLRAPGVVVDLGVSPPELAPAPPSSPRPKGAPPPPSPPSPKSHAGRGARRPRTA